MKKKKLAIFSAIVLSLGIAGVWSYHAILDVAADKISAELSTPEFEKALDKLKNIEMKSNPASVSSEVSETKATYPSNEKSFTSRDEAVKFVLSKFSLSEAKYVKDLVSEGLTPENKSELKNIALEKFTVDEILAIQQAVQ